MDRLIEKIKKTNNPTVVGLDPNLDLIPRFIKEKSFEDYGENLQGAANSVLVFNKMIIDALYDIVPAVKPQSAYYEMLGYHGIEVLKETIDYAKSKDMYVILDGKRNDIGATSTAYACAYLGKTVLSENNKQKAFGADSLTVNGYLGYDGIKPFAETFEKGKTIFALVKTSNKSSGELQDLELKNGRKVYEEMAYLVDKWGKDSIGEYGYSKIGAVVGATYPEELKNVRKSNPNTYFLVPGYGAQGGTAKDVANAFNNDGLGAIVNSSRGILYAYAKGNYKEMEFDIAARNEAIKMRDEIVSFIK